MITMPCQKPAGETACCTCSMPAGFFVFIVLVVSIAVVVLRRVKRCNDGILSEGRFDKTTRRWRGLRCVVLSNRPSLRMPSLHLLTRRRTTTAMLTTRTIKTKNPAGIEHVQQAVSPAGFWHGMVIMCHLA